MEFQTTWGLAIVIILTCFIYTTHSSEKTWENMTVAASATYVSNLITLHEDDTFNVCSECVQIYVEETIKLDVIRTQSTWTRASSIKTTNVVVWVVRVSDAPIAATCELGWKSTALVTRDPRDDGTHVFDH